MRVAMFLMLAAASSAKFQLPSTRHPDLERDWGSALIYQIYTRSFKDYNGDGIGDIKGIIMKLPFLARTGVDAIWISTIFKSPMQDYGYDVSNFLQIDPAYGTMLDFEQLLSVAKSLDIRVILDFIPNHTSNESEWFIKSSRSEPGYENYYVWVDGPTNNWVSVYHTKAWEFHPERGQYYLHQFLPCQPDLNYWEPRVQKEMEYVLRYWLDKGVSGFRVDSINYVVEVDPWEHGGMYPNEPIAANSLMYKSTEDYRYLVHNFTKDRPEVFDLLRQWRNILNDYGRATGDYKLLLVEVYAKLDQVTNYYGDSEQNVSIPTNFVFRNLVHKGFNAWDYIWVIEKWLRSLPKGQPANWVSGNHDQSRVATRLGKEQVDFINMLVLLLPGITITYQGEEIGLEDGMHPELSPDDPKYKYKESRNPYRTPYQWDNSTNAGFSNIVKGRTWLAFANDYKIHNLGLQMKAVNSHYKFYRDVANLKKNSKAVRTGSFEIKAFTDHILLLTRLLEGSPAVIAIGNLHKYRVVNLKNLTRVPDDMVVVAAGVNCELQKGVPVKKTFIPLSQHCTLVLETRDTYPQIVKETNSINKKSNKTNTTNVGITTESEHSSTVQDVKMTTDIDRLENEMSTSDNNTNIEENSNDWTTQAHKTTGTDKIKSKVEKYAETYFSKNTETSTKKEIKTNIRLFENYDDDNKYTTEVDVLDS